jgi:hypothetical protein
VTRAALAAALGLGVAATTAHADARLDAFRSACIPYRANYEATWLKAKQDGWTEVTADDHAELAATIDLLREENDPQGLAILSPFRKEIAGRPLHLVAASFPQDLSLVTSCFLFDFDAGEAIDPNLISEWLNAPPDEALGASGEGGAETWRDVESLPDAAVKSVFVPEGSPAISYTGFTGIMLGIDSVGQ